MIFSPLHKLIVAAVAMAVVLGLVYAYGQTRWGDGYAAGVERLTGPLAECRTELATIKEAQDAMAHKNAELLQRANRSAQDAAAAWDHARSIKPRVVRVRNCPASGGGEVQAGGDTAQPTDLAGGSGMGAAGTVAEELSIEEINRRLNAAEKAAGQLAHLIAAVQKQQEIYQ